MNKLTPYKEKLIFNIEKYSKNCWDPINLDKVKKSNFDIFTLTCRTNQNIEPDFTFSNYEHVGQTCKIVNIYFDKVQKSIIKTWFSIYKKYYKFTIKIFSYLNNLTKTFLHFKFYDIRDILTNLISYDISNNYKFNTFYVNNKKIIRHFYNYRNNDICNKEIKLLKKSYIKFKFDKQPEFIDHFKLKQILYKFIRNLESYNFKYFTINIISNFYEQLNDKYKNILLSCDINFDFIIKKIKNIDFFTLNYINIHEDKLQKTINSNFLNYNDIYKKYIKYEDKLLENNNKKIYNYKKKIINIFDDIFKKYFIISNNKILSDLYSQFSNHNNNLKNYKNNIEYVNKKNDILRNYNFIIPDGYKKKINEMRKSCVSKKIKIINNELHYVNIIGTDHLNIYEPQYKEKKRNRTNISRHTVDNSIHKALSNYKTCITNFKDGNIKKFNLKKINLYKNILDIEQTEFINSSYRGNILGKVIAFYDNILFDFNEIKQTSILKHESGKYILYVPYMNEILSEDDKIDELEKLNKKLEKVKQLNKKRKHRRYKKRNNKNKKVEKIKSIKKKIKKISKKKKKVNSRASIGLDPGIRKFITGYSNEKKVNIEVRPKKKLSNNLDKLYGQDPSKKKIEGKKIIKKVKGKKEIKRISRKISRQVKDFHDKLINYLTENYSEIIMGNMMTQEIISKKRNLSKKNKNLCSRLRIGLFREKLKMKCKEKKIHYILQNEAYTSKICSKCGSIKENLRDAEIYKCVKCNQIMDRDLNASKNIYLASL